MWEGERMKQAPFSPFPHATFVHCPTTAKRMDKPHAQKPTLRVGWKTFAFSYFDGKTLDLTDVLGRIDLVDALLNGEKKIDLPTKTP